MGNSASKKYTSDEELLSNQNNNSHPLLISIDNPINRYSDAFISNLKNKKKKEIDIQSEQIIEDQLEIPGYSINSIIGRGAESFVYKGIDISTGEKVAVKVFKRYDGINQPKEISIAKMMNHKHLLKFLNSFEIQKSTNEKFFIAIMPFADYGALNNSDVPEITIMMAIELLLQIGGALCYMHDKNIIHHDIKPQNILLFNYGFVLCDFSVSVVLENEDQLLRDRTGTSVFMAPEISQNSYKPKPTDMWSLGITVFCLLFGKYPYNLGSFDQNPSIPP